MSQRRKRFGNLSCKAPRIDPRRQRQFIKIFLSPDCREQSPSSEQEDERHEEAALRQ